MLLLCESGTRLSKISSYPYNTPQPETPTALQSLINGKTELAETRLAVTAAQVIERLRIRAKHLEELMNEELAVGTQLLQTRSHVPGADDMMGLEALLTERGAQIQSERRKEDTECWRDLTNVLRDLLNAWEGFSRNEAKNRFLAALPKSHAEPVANEQRPIPRTHYHNEYRNTPYNQQPYK